MSRPATLLLLALVACGPKQPTEPAAGSAAAEAPTTAPTAEAKKEQPLYELVNSAVALMKPGADPASLQRAIGLLQQALAREPANPTVRFDLGVAKHRLGDLAGAQREYQTVVGQDPTFAKAWLHLGQIPYEQGKASEAEATWRAGQRNAPDDIALRVALIELLRTTGRVDAAINEAKTALAINANSVEVYNAMGLCWQEKGDLVLARFVYQKALAGIPGADTNAWLHLNLGWTYYLDGRTPLAVQELERALELDPYLVPALINLSRIYMDERNYGDTIPLLERAVARAPNDAGVRMNLGIAYRGVGRFAEAEREYREVMRLDPTDPTPWMNLGILFGDHTKNYDAAVDAFQKYIAGGGKESARAREYIALVTKERELVEKRKKAEEERKKREAERAEQKRLLEEAAKKKPAPEAPAPKPETPAPTPDSPWGGTP